MLKFLEEKEKFIINILKGPKLLLPIKEVLIILKINIIEEGHWKFNDWKRWNGNFNEW